ncbi:protein MAIN-LIKE 2-like [Trifolium pratense]|uniref:protein MAIN-LIKE 2-like n=1 Tax=Trifolium pratense TaxID=57577 RepID=UPI001E6978EF|nr:protein MAIN-LIKE 2-like [Trifolium pratense]
MSTKKSNTFCIYHSRIATLISPNSGKLVTTHFLKPCSKNSTPTLISPQTLFQINQYPHPKIHFKGWNNPQTKWGDWVEKLTAEQAYTWNKTGICDALLSSLHHFPVPRNPSLILALVQHWSPKTNTFVFPWGEATITLEDVMILGGFSVLGESVKLPLSSDLLSIEAKLIEIRRRMLKSKSKKVSHNAWLKFFKEGLEEENCDLFNLEHVGFLCLWLSRFVFPSCSDSVIDPRVFSIAIHLSQGKRMALASSVLASIYHNLSLLKEKLVSSSSSVKDFDVKVNGLFQLVQQWLFERFPILGPKYPNELKKGEPRAARWHKLNSESEHASFEFILSKLESGENFVWRPYVLDLKNWCFVSHYKESEQFVNDGSNSDLEEELRCFGVCLCADEVIGLDCVEMYMPYRVTMQFGIDQDVPPNEFIVMSPCYNENFSFYVPSKYYKPCVSLEYHNWWKKSKVIEGKNVDGLDLVDDVVMIAKQYCEDENHASIASIENGSKRKSSSNNESKDNEGESGTKRRVLKKNESSSICGFNNDIGVGDCEVLFMSGKGKKQLGVGSYDNPLDVEDYGCTILGTSSSHPISI